MEDNIAPGFPKLWDLFFFDGGGPQTKDKNRSIAGIYGEHLIGSARIHMYIQGLTRLRASIVT